MSDDQRDRASRNETSRLVEDFFDTTTDLACITKAGVVERANKRWLDILGWESAQMVGRSVADFIHPDDLAAVFAPEFELQWSEHETHITPTGDAQEFSWVVLRRRAD